MSNAQTIRKGKGRGRGKGKGRYPGGSAVGSTNAEDYIFNNKIEMQQVRCHFCQAFNIEGTHKCQSCFKWIIAWSDRRIATEVCRLESTAKKTNAVSWRWTKWILRNSRGVRECRTGHVLTSAGQEEEIFMGFTSIQDRMERGPYYLFNNATAQITPDGCQFLELVVKCLSPDMGRSRESREKQL